MKFRNQLISLFFVLMSLAIHSLAFAADAAKVTGNLVVDGIRFSSGGSPFTSSPNSMLNGTLDPVPQNGSDGDFYINTATNKIFGPKSNSAWPAGVSLVGPAGSAGPAGSPGATGPIGPQGPPGNGTAVNFNYLYTKQGFSSFVPAIGVVSAYTQTGSLTNLYDTTGKATGWIQTTQDGKNNSDSNDTYGIPVTTVAYYTAHDTHNSPIAGYFVNNKNSAVTNFIQSYTYDVNGKKTQRVRTSYDNANAITQIQTTNYDPTHHGATTSVSTLNSSSGITTTTTYSYTSYDSNGYAMLATTSTTNGTQTWPGTAVFEYSQFIPGSTTSGPYITAMALVTQGGSVGFTGQVQIYTDNSQQTPVTNATVTINGIPLSYDGQKNQYSTTNSLGALGGTVTLNVTVGGATYTSTGTQYTKFPSITSTSTWTSASSNDITWTVGAPTNGAENVVGIMGNSGIIFPAGDNGPAGLAVDTTKYNVPASSLAPGSYQVLIGIGTPGMGNQVSGTGILIPGAASGSALWIGAVTLSPLTVQ